VTFVYYALAALAEIAGCFAFWAWLREGGSRWWLVPGVLSLIGFALILTRIDVSLAGRAYAAYGGIYVAASLIWMWAVEQRVPDKGDFTGAIICIIGAGTILFWPRGA